MPPHGISGHPADIPIPEETERERVEKENQRKQEEYDKKVQDGIERADTLNAQFADWFYVISDADYEKIDRGYGEFIQDKVAEAPFDNGDPADPHVHQPGDGHVHQPGDPDHAHEQDEPASTLDEFRRLKEEGPGEGH